MKRATRSSEIAACWVLLLFLSNYGSVAQTPVYSHAVYVNNSHQNASDSSQCGHNASMPCRTLSYTLKTRVLNSTQVVINSGGCYTLNESITIHNKSIVAVTTSGNGSNEQGRVAIHCTKGSGLSFVDSYNITLYGLKLLQCSALQTSTSRNFSSSEFSFMTFYVALHFLSCSNISLISITISDSRGTGVAVYTNSGYNYFHDCNLTNNGSPGDNTHPSGGGMYIEFPFCSPRDPEQCQNETVETGDDYVSSAVYEITHSRFEENTAHMWHPISYQYLLPEATNHLTFGNGGGLSVYFSRAKHTSVRVSKCLFQSNTAEWGGGATVEFQGMSWNNSFVMESCIVINNTVLSTNSSQGHDWGGGGLKLSYTSLNSSKMAHNTMTFVNCNISYNSAMWGGGVLVRAAREQQQSQTNFLRFYHCSWVNNTGRVGSAMNLAVWNPLMAGVELRSNFTNCSFKRNSANDIVHNLSLIGVGSLYTQSIPLKFENSVVFENNNRSAIVAVDALVDFEHNCSANFTNNIGRNGGAIALLGSAFLRVHDHTNMTFIGNIAERFGGAIYHSALGQHELYLFGYCFIQCVNYTTPPCSWTSKFYFKNNKAGFNEGGNSIYATSLIPCFWSYTSPNVCNTTHSNSTEEIFCYKNERWNYTGNCSSEVCSAPANFGTNKNHTGENYNHYHMQLVPGKRQTMPLKLWGDNGNDQTENAIMNIRSLNRDVASVPSDYTYVSDNNIILHGISNSSVTLAIETLDPRVVYSEISVKILPCPPGFTNHSNNSDSRCLCNQNFNSVLHCSKDDFTASLRRGLWMGEVDKHIVVGTYPYTNPNWTDTYIELANNTADLDEQLCGHANRRGQFCAECKEGFGPSINSLYPRCVHCHPDKVRYYWMLYIVAEVLPVTIFFFVIMLFHISVTRGALNSFVLFAQVITTTFDITGDHTIPLRTITHSGMLENAYMLVYNFWSLDFSITDSLDFCLSPHLNTLTALSFQYILAFYSLSLIIVFYWIVRMYENGIQPFFLLGKPIHRLLRFFRQRWNLKRSTVDTFSTFLVLSSTKFTVVSVFLLTTVTYIKSKGAKLSKVMYFQGNVEYLSDDHLPFFLLALFVLSTCVLLPTLLLLVYPLKMMEWLADRLGRCGHFFRPGNRMHLFLDTFQGCFKDGTDGTRDCRYFAGVYFILRAALFTTYAYSAVWLQQYIIQQLVCTFAIFLIAIVRPYKKDFYTNLDITILAILAAINTLSIYNIYYASQGFTLEKWAFAVQYMLIYCPFVYLVGYILWKILGGHKKVILQLLNKCLMRHNLERQALLSDVLKEGSQPSSIDDEYRQFADEVEAFGRDKERNQYQPKPQTSGATSSSTAINSAVNDTDVAPDSGATHAVVIPTASTSDGVST